jgi:Protein of unknown function (DUF3168).
MSFETDFIAKYAALFNGRLYWDESPEGWTAEQRAAPFAIAQQVGGSNRQYVDDKEQPEFLNARVQVDVWGSRRMEVSDAMRSFVAAVMQSNTADWYAREMGEVIGDHNEVLKLRGSRQDFNFSFRNPRYVP